MAGEVRGDAGAALGITHRHGLGIMKHTDTSLFWVQESVAKKALKYQKVFGKENPADLYTKYLDHTTGEYHESESGFECVHGRAIAALKSHNLARFLDGCIGANGTEEREYLTLPRNARKNATGVREAMIGLVEDSVNEDGVDGDITSPGQSVSRGYGRQVEGTRGRATAQFGHLLGSTQSIRFRHNRATYLCMEGRVTGIDTRGIVRTFMVVPRRDKIRLFCEKGQPTNETSGENNEPEGREQLQPEIVPETLPQHGATTIRMRHHRSKYKAEREDAQEEVRCRAVSSHQSTAHSAETQRLSAGPSRPTSQSSTRTSGTLTCERRFVYHEYKSGTKTQQIHVTPKGSSSWHQGFHGHANP